MILVINLFSRDIAIAMTDSVIFHLAIPIDNVTQAKQFYSDGLGCTVGRENSQAVILDFYGHQVVAHVTQEPLTSQKGIYPRHFGLILPSKEDWDKLVTRAKEKELKFYQEPKQRFPQKLTEHWTFFLEDPFSNLLEFKYYTHDEAIFGGRSVDEIGDR
ncbi:MAG: VOC family protein [Xenococcaceae cyanobacterium MO_207.B15]|nr:VOC family protein [Xenococcaceae cyanobacterium MO_207.B15]MDJ0742654.1 VOC family protein [Xenococcaceae cyanobacterium MO_167.B27]